MSSTIIPEESNAILLETDLAEVTQREYVCAGCWGRLNLYYLSDQLVRITCDNCGDGRGFVRKSWVERRRGEDFADASEIRRMLRMMHVLEHKPRTEDEILHEMGF